MYERINWTMEDSFWVLNMMGQFTDAELTGFGMSPEDIIKYREFVKREDEEDTRRREDDHDRIDEEHQDEEGARRREGDHGRIDEEQ